MATYLDQENPGTPAAAAPRRTSPVLLGALSMALVALALAWYLRRDAGPQTPPLADTSQTVPMDAPAAAPAAVPPRTSSTPAQPRAVAADRAPRPLAGNPLPAYPRTALRNGTEGDVVLSIAVGADGHPTDVDVIERSGTRDRAFDRAAIQAARQWRFEPAMRGGEAVPATVRLPVEFRRG